MFSLERRSANTSALLDVSFSDIRTYRFVLKGYHAFYQLTYLGPIFSLPTHGQPSATPSTR